MSSAEVYVFRREHEHSIETYSTTHYLADGDEGWGKHGTPDEVGFVLVAHAVGRDEDDAHDWAQRGLCAECRLPRKPFPPPTGYTGAECSCVCCDGCCVLTPAAEVEDGMCRECRS